MSTKKLGLNALVLMIFTSVFGFSNMPRSFYLMGYSAIPWYLLSAIIFFLPFAFMIAEFGAAFKDSDGGIYTWMEASSGPKFAFLVTFMWYTGFIVWMVNVGSGIWVVLSNAIWGVDKTQTWTIFGLDSVKTLGLLAVFWIMAVTFLSSRGIDKIKKVTSVGGTAVSLLHVFLFLGGMIILILNGGSFKEPFSVQALFTSPNPAFIESFQILSFVVFAIFAYGGIEVVGGLVNQTDNADKVFPKGVTIAAIVISIGYSIGIFMFGTFTNWTFAFSEFPGATVTLGNVSYIAMNQMGYQIGLAFGLAESQAVNIGLIVSRYMGISMFLALTGAFFTLIYSPLKQLIGGTPRELWPESWTKQKNGTYATAMNYQAATVIVLLLLVSFGGDSAKQFFQILVAMSNVSMTIPYMFIAYSFLDFKKNKNIIKPFEKYKSMTSTKLAVFLVCFTVGFANLFTIIEPVLSRGDWLTTIMSIVGPFFFTGIALVLYNRSASKKA